MEELNFQSLELALVKKSKSDNRFHDRFILTNTYAIKSGHSFNYFDLEGHFSLPSNTDLEVYPLFGFSKDSKKNRITYAKYYHQHLVELADIISDSQNKMPGNFDMKGHIM